MVEPCDNCSCGLDDEEQVTETVEIPCQLQFSRIVREYVLDQADLEDGPTFIQKVEICPDGVTVHYRDDL